MSAPSPRVTRIAFWSGPRNVSTALLRSWGSRADTVVVDEPLYAHYLAETGFVHPAREEILASQPNAAADVVARLLGELPAGKSVSYQKHMAHHLLPSVPREWLDDVRHGFLLRDPSEVIASYTKIVADPRPEDLGAPQMTEIFQRVVDKTGAVPPVVDSKDLLDDPRGVLEKVCAAFGLAFDDAMLSWEKGPRDTDGVWAPHWYSSVEESTGFAPYTPREVELPASLRTVSDACREHYDAMREHRITG